jgi:hypothetical protein
MEAAGGLSFLTSRRAVMSDLVERVARTFCSQPSEKCSKCNGSSDCWYMHTARAAIAVVLEEAADAVGEVGDHADAGAYIAAIRAMIPKEEV